MIANGGGFPTLGLTSSKQVGGCNDTSRMQDNDIEFDPATGETYQCIIAKQKQTISTKNDDDDYVPFESTGIAHSAAMSQMTILPDDVGVDERVMPKGLSDINGQQLDLRTQNSWLLKMDEVSTPELMECMFVNAIAPFVLNSRLKPLMEAPADDPSRPGRYIINVSAMEGKFYRYKMPNHPHTNMAKAALNMLTRTSSEDLAKRSRIYMNSVDTGWINDENPLEKAAKISKDNNFQTPIDEVDAAARILDPVFVGINADGATPGAMKVVKDYGKFFKDYKESEW
jgi:NAD(P)-dependent dehydrogenase (short-subunit alcohol dehydrogenase family)